MDYVNLLLKPKGNIWMELRDSNLPTCPLKAKTLLNMLFFFLGPTEQLTGSQFPSQGSNPGSQQWKHSGLTSGPSGNPKMFSVRFIDHIEKQASYLIISDDY